MTHSHRGKLLLVDSAVAAGSTFSAGGVAINDVGDPVALTDAATRNFVLSGPPVLTKNRVLSTGVLSGGLLTIEGDPDVATTFAVSDGDGIIVDSSTGIVTEVSWSGLTTQSTAYSGILTFVSLNAGGTPTFATTRPTPPESRTAIFLGVLVHITGQPNPTTLTLTNDEQGTALQVGNQLQDLMRSIGFFNVDGNLLAGVAGTLQITKSSGTMFAAGANFKNDANNPHRLVVPAIDTSDTGIFQYRYQDGSSSALTLTDLIPSDFDDGNGQGTPGSVGGGSYTTSRAYIFTGGALKIQPGQFTYNSQSDSITSILTEGFVTEPSIVANGLLIGFITIRGNASNLNNALFTPSSRFGASSTGSSQSLQEVYDSSGATPTIVTSSTGSEVIVKRGTSTDADSVFKVVDGSDAAQLEVFGDRVALGAVTLHPTSTPASATAAGVTGQIVWDATHIYVCVATNTWQRVAHATWV